MASDTCFIHHSRGWKYSHGLLKKYLVVSRVEWPRSPAKKTSSGFKLQCLKLSEGQLRLNASATF